MSVRSAVVRVSADVAGLIAGYGKAEAATKKLADSGVAMSAKHKAAINTVTRGFGIMGAAAAAGVGIAIKTAADFDAKMSGVKAVTGAGADEMLRLRDAAIKAGAATRYSAGEAADGISELAKAGISTADILNGGLNGALALASAGEIAVGSAAQDMATAMTQFHLKGTQATHVADLLAAGANKAQGEVGDLAFALNYAGLPAHAMGVSLNQTVGTLALFAKNGLLGSQAGTTLRGILSSLASPSKKAADEMQSLGINVFDAKGNFIGMNGVAQVLHERLSGLTQQQRQYALGVIFSNAQLQGANILYQSGAAGVDTWTKKVNDSGAAARVSAEKMNNLSGDIEQLRGSLQTALIGAGEGAQSPLRGITQDLTKVVNKFNDLSPAAQSNVTKTVAAVALLGGTGFVIGKMVIGINSARVALAELAAEGTATRGALSFLGKGLVVAGVVYGLDQIASHLLAAHNDAHTLRQDLQLMALGVPAQPQLDFGFKTLGGQIREAAQEQAIFSGGIGKSLLDMAPDFTKTSDNIAQIDQQLARLARTDPKAAASAFASIKDQARQAGVSMEALANLFPKVMSVLGQGKRAKASIIDEGALLNGLTKLRDYRSQLMHLPQAVLTKVASPQLLTTTKQVEQLAKQYKLTPKQVQTIMQARDFASADIRKVLKALGELNHTHAKSKIEADNTAATNRYRQTKEQLIELGRMHPMSTLDANPDPAIQSSKSVLHWYGVVDHTNPRSTITVDVGQALGGIGAVLRQMGLLHDKSVTLSTNIVTHHSTTYGGVAGGGGHSALTPASGGYVRGPGTTTSDSIPAMLSDKEYVVNAAAVAKYGVGFFHKANRMQLAGGGFVSRTPGGGWSGGPRTVRLEGPVEVRGKVDLDTGRLVGTMHAIARQEIDDTADFTDTMAGAGRRGPR